MSGKWFKPIPYGVRRDDELLDMAAVERLAGADAFRSMGMDRRAALWDAKALKGAPDLPLFAAAVIENEAARDELADAVAAIEPDSLSPREALEELYKLKRIAAERSAE